MKIDKYCKLLSFSLSLPFSLPLHVGACGVWGISKYNQLISRQKTRDDSVPFAIGSRRSILNQRQRSATRRSKHDESMRAGGNDGINYSQEIYVCVCVCVAAIGRLLSLWIRVGLTILSLKLCSNPVASFRYAVVRRIN